MSNFTFTLQVMVGVTPALESLLAKLFSPEREESQSAVAANRSIVQANKAYIQALDNYQAAPSPQPEAPQPEAPQAEAPATPAAPTYTVENVREMMDRTRRRIEGENYKQDTSSELYAKYHKALTATFKQIAMQISADSDKPTDKPTELPNDLRGLFGEKCDEIYIDEKGDIAIKLPF